MPTDKPTADETLALYEEMFKTGTHAGALDAETVLTRAAGRVLREKELTELRVLATFLDTHEWDAAYNRTCETLRCRYGYEPMPRNAKSVQWERWGDHFRGLFLDEARQIRDNIIQSDAVRKLSTSKNFTQNTVANATM